MILITENAEVRLQKALLLARDKKTPVKCVRVEHAGLDDAGMSLLVQTIDDVVDDPDGSVFDCEGNLLFVLAQGVTGRTVEKLNETLAQKFSGRLPPAVVLDPVGQWKTLMDEVDAQAARVEARATAQRQDTERAQRERLRQMILNMPIEKEILQSLARRRRERDRIGIALVEDDVFTRNLVSGTLKANFEITTMGDGYNAIAKYPARAPDILFLDIDLPDVSGLDILKKILEMDPEAYVVMLSGNSQKENIMKAMDSGAKGFVGKPFTKDKLLQYIQKCPRYKLLQPMGVRT